jgi:Protein of unknown function (DUF3352)
VRTKFKAPKWVVAGTAVAAAFAVTAAGVVVAGAVNGGGPQPEDVLPANAMAFTKLDLNPSARQKLAVYQLASKFPKVKSKVTSEDTSIKESIFGSLFTGTGKDAIGLDFKKDVQPWLGDRIGVGVFPALPGEKNPKVGIAIAFTDHNAAKTALDKAVALSLKQQHASASLDGNDGNAPVMKGYAFTDDGYVIVSDTTAHATAIASAGKVKPLAKSTYAQDVKTLGSDQVAVAWADVAAVYKAIPKDKLNQSTFGMLQGPLKGVNDLKNASGRVIMGLHADPAFLEVTGKAIDVKGVNAAVKTDPGNGAALVGSFPSQVFGAVTLTGLGKAVGALYTSFTESGDPFQVKSTLDAMGITSAKQIETLLGAETGVMVAGTKDSPEFAIRTRGAHPNEALSIAQKVLTANPEAPGISVAKIAAPDGIVVSMGTDLTASIFDKAGTKLASTPGFKQVIAGGPADFAAYVNLAKAVPMIPSDTPADAASLKPFNALGMTVTGGTVPTVRFRISFK